MPANPLGSCDEVRLLDARTFAPAGQLPEAAADAAFLGDTLAVAGKDEDGAFVRIYDLRKVGARSEPLCHLDVGKAAQTPAAQTSFHAFEEGATRSLMKALQDHVGFWKSGDPSRWRPRLLTVVG